MRAETMWRSSFVWGLAVVFPVGVLISVIGFAFHTWPILWAGVVIVAIGVLLVLYAILAPMFRISTGIGQLHRQISNNVIGQDIAWEDVKEKNFLVLEFVPNASVDEEKVKANSRSEPYAMLRLQSLDHPGPLVMPVLHRLGFLYLWRCFNEQAVGEAEELMVSYIPPRLGKVMPHLGLMIGPKGLAQTYMSGQTPSMEVFQSIRIYWDPSKAGDY